MKILMTHNEINLFKSYLEKTTNYFEFGGGGSTVLANSYSNIQKIIAIDSNIDWINKIKNNLNTNKIGFCYIDVNAPRNSGYPKDESKKENWELYSNSISNYNKNNFDLILVDGRFRVACAIKSYLHMNDTNILLVHDYNRTHYRDIEKLFVKISSIGTLTAFSKKSSDIILINELYQKYKFDPR